MHVWYLCAIALCMHLCTVITCMHTRCTNYTLCISFQHLIRRFCLERSYFRPFCNLLRTAYTTMHRAMCIANTAILAVATHVGAFMQLTTHCTHYYATCYVLLAHCYSYCMTLCSGLTARISMCSYVFTHCQHE